MYLIVSGSTHFLCPPCRLFFSFFVFFFVLVRHVCCVQAPFHCTEAFNAESATRVMLLMFITLSIFVKSFDKHTQGMRCWFRVSLWWNVFTKTDRDPHCFLGFSLYVWVRVRVCSSVPPSLFVQYELSISASRRVWEEQIDPQTSRPRARNRRSLCRRGAVCISGSQSEAKQKQHPAFRLHFNTSFKTENMEHSPENVEKSLLLKMQRCVIQDPHQQKRRWEENIPQRRMN